MTQDDSGNFSVTSRKGIALVGFLVRREDGSIHASANAPTWLSDDDKATVLRAVEDQQTELTLGDETYRIDLTWNVVKQQEED